MDFGTIALGMLGAGGQMITNKQNRDTMREQMNFQERMSTTAVQRSVEDYRRAGLNPGLAYERSASSPGGASTTIGDVASAGVASAQRAREVRAALALNKAQQYKTMQDADLAFEQKMEVQRQRNFNKTQEPATAAINAANAILQQHLIPAAANTAAFERRLGEAKPGLASAKTLMEVLKLFRSH